MQPTLSPTLRTLFAAAAVVVATLGLSAVSVGFLPADPHVEIARGQALLERVENVRHAQWLHEARVKTASVTTIIR